MTYFINENLFSSNQYGFQPGYTTTDCLIDRIKGITISLDQGNYVVSLFLDLSKAFDTVNHLILLEKLNYYGLQQSEVYWFRPYLCSRIQQIYVNGVKSDFHLIFSGIPQGSISGPLLFLVYINNFPESTTYFSSRLYVDDTSLTASGTNLNILLNDIHNHL